MLRFSQSCAGHTVLSVGQRCTAIKLVIAEKSVAPVLVEKLAAAIEGLERGLPWDAGVEITPLPEPNKPQYLAELVDDIAEYLPLGPAEIAVLMATDHGLSALLL